jgi:hypothetical protein
MRSIQGGLDESSPYKIASLLLVFNYVFIMRSIQGGLDESSPYNK